MKERKHMDISELYDLFRERRECYFICCDIKGLLPINDIAHQAGDLAILESMKRISDAAGEEDIVFRIGGDEFALLTSSAQVQYAEHIVEKLQSSNGETFCYNGIDIPLSLHTGIARFDKSPIKYNELFTELHTVVKNIPGKSDGNGK